MLYESWREVAARQAGVVALVDFSAGRRWTFGQLSQLAERGRGRLGSVVFPQAQDATFILAILRAWRKGIPICPLEPGQKPPLLTKLPKTCAHVKTTSGTSGEGKFVLFTARQVAADVENITRTMGLRPEWPNLGTISLSHSYGFSNLVLPLLLKGIPLILAGSSLPERVRAAAQCVPEITLPAVPALWRVWAEAGAIPGNIRLAISAGAPLPLALEENILREFHLKVHNFYGATECGGIAYDETEQARQDPAFAGRPLKGVEVLLEADGCLTVRSEAAGLTYWPRGNDRLGNGLFRSADLAEVRDGGVFLCGRLGDRINVAGRKVSPESIEAVLLRHPEVRSCVVFGVPGRPGAGSERIVACAALRRPLAVARLRQFLSQELPAWQVPREWVFLDALEVNRRGKISRAQWRERFLRGALG